MVSKKSVESGTSERSFRIEEPKINVQSEIAKFEENAPEILNIPQERKSLSEGRFIHKTGIRNYEPCYALKLWTNISTFYGEGLFREGVGRNAAYNL